MPVIGLAYLPLHACQCTPTHPDAAFEVFYAARSVCYVLPTNLLHNVVVWLHAWTKFSLGSVFRALVLISPRFLLRMNKSSGRNTLLAGNANEDSCLWAQSQITVSCNFNPGIDYSPRPVFKGASVSATGNGTLVGSRSYNSGAVDGQICLFGQGGLRSFDRVRARTNDPAFRC